MKPYLLLLALLMVGCELTDSQRNEIQEAVRAKMIESFRNGYLSGYNLGRAAGVNAALQNELDSWSGGGRRTVDEIYSLADSISNVNGIIAKVSP